MNQTAHELKDEITSTANSHVSEAIISLDKLPYDIDEDRLSDLIRVACEDYQFDGVLYQYEAFLAVTSNEFPNSEDQDFTGMDSAIDCLMMEANDIAEQVYREAKDEAIGEAVERILEIHEKAQELGYDGAYWVNTSSLYGWAPHNYETMCGICIWSDERIKGACFPQLLEGELWAIEGSWNGLTFGACWTPGGNA